MDPDPQRYIYGLFVIVVYHVTIVGERGRREEEQVWRDPALSGSQERRCCKGEKLLLFIIISIIKRKSVIKEYFRNKVIIQYSCCLVENLRFAKDILCV